MSRTNDDVIPEAGRRSRGPCHPGSREERSSEREAWLVKKVEV
jgi:hypothetical protein